MHGSDYKSLESAYGGRLRFATQECHMCVCVDVFLSMGCPHVNRRSSAIL